MSRVTPLPTTAFADEMLGEVRALAATVGQPGTAAMGDVQRLSLPSTLTTVAAWRGFVGDYFRDLLVAHEWPLIVQAHGFAGLGHARELVALDQAWGRSRDTLPARLQFLDEASFRVGQRQLKRLRPLRDLRLVQRYLAAIEAGEAHGWHPLVYGVVLGLFALPLRQGLAHYGRQTAAGILVGTPLAANLSEARQVELVDEATLTFQTALQHVLPAARLVAI